MGEVEVQPAAQRPEQQRSVGGMCEGLVVVGLAWPGGGAHLQSLHLKERKLSKTTWGGIGEVREEMCPRPGFGSS